MNGSLSKCAVEVLLTFKTCVIAVIPHTPAYRTGRFTKAERLKSRKFIQTLFREGKAFSVFPYRIYYRLVDTTVSPGPVQVGFAVSSRSFSRAVDRNRIKRLGREAWRLQKHALFDFLTERKCSLHLFFVYTGREVPPCKMVYDKLSVILNKLVKELERTAS